MSESSKLNVLCTGENKNDSIKKQIEIVSSGEKRVYKSVAMGLTEIELIQVLVDNTRVPGIIKQQHNQLPKTFLNQFYCLRKAGLPVVDFFYIKDDPEYVEGEECTSIQSAM